MTDISTQRLRQTAPPIVIAGGGIGGLSAALALAETGWRVTVLERREGASEDGAGIQIGPNGTRILRALGVEPFLKDAIAAPEAIRVMDGLTGRQLTRLPLGHHIAQAHGAPYWVLHRADLHAALRKAASQTTLIDMRSGCDVASAMNTREGVVAILRDGTQYEGSALIAADGLWSTVRNQVISAPALAFTGKSAFRAVIPARHLPADISPTDTTIWLAPAAHVVHYPVRAGQEMALVVIFDDRDLGETWAGSADPVSVTERAQHFPDALRGLLKTPEVWRQWSLYALPGSFPWVEGRIALLGDAAHPPLPFLAQGGVMALEDAVVLAAHLKTATPDELPKQLAAYARIRQPRTQRVMAASARNGRIYHLTGPMRMARNAVLQWTPPDRLMAKYNWLYGWSLPGEPLA